MRAQLNLKCPFISIFSCSEDAGIPYCGNETTPRHWQYIDGFVSSSRGVLELPSGRLGRG